MRSRRLPAIVALVLTLSGLGLLVASQSRWPTGWLGWDRGPMLYGQVVKGSVVLSWLGEARGTGKFIAWTEWKGPRKAERRASRSWLGRFDWLHISGVSSSVVFPLALLLPLPWIWPLWQWAATRRRAGDG